MKNIISLELLFPLWSNFDSSQDEGREDAIKSSTLFMQRIENKQFNSETLDDNIIDGH